MNRSNATYDNELETANVALDNNTTTAAYLSQTKNISEAWQDIVEGTKNWRLWGYMAVSEVRRRYRRTLIGPFWTTLSLGMYIGSMGILFSYLWKSNMRDFLPFFSSGYICWIFLSTIITESCSVFVAAEGLLKQISLPYSTFAWLVVARNLLLLAHHAIIYILIMLIFAVPIHLNTLLIVPALLLLSVTGFWLTMIMGLVCARYRDLLQVVATLLQIALFITPIFWTPTQLSGIRSTVFVNFNPLYHCLDIIRSPLIGKTPALLSWCTAVGLTISIAGIAFWLFSVHRRKLIFWL